MTDLIKQLNEIHSKEQIPREIDLSTLPPHTRAIVQQTDILKQLSAHYMRRAGEFLLAHPTYLNQAQMNTRTQQHHGQYVDPNNQAMHLYTFTGPNSPVTCNVERAARSRSSQTYTWNLRIRLFRDTIKTPTRFTEEGPELFHPDHIKADLQHIFGEENVTNFFSESGNKRTGGESKYMIACRFDLPRYSEDILLGVDGNVRKMASIIKQLARYTHNSNQQVLDYLTSVIRQRYGYLEENYKPVSKTLHMIIEEKQLSKHRYILSGLPTELHTKKHFFDVANNRWSEQSDHATRLTLDEALEVMEALRDYDYVHVVEPVRVRH